MTLILQIAAGIVLGFLIIQNLPRILHVLRKVARVGLIWGIVIGLVVLLVLGAEALRGHWDEAGKILAVLAALAVLMAAIQYSARGLGYLYVSQRARVAASRRWTNLLRMIGVHPSWHTTNLPKAEIATKVGDALFTGLWKFLLFYFLASMAVLLLLVQAIGATPLDKAKPSTAAVVWVVSALVPGVLVFLWISRRPRARTPDSETTPPGNAQ
jgi:hypothetical protein